MELLWSPFEAVDSLSSKTNVIVAETRNRASTDSSSLYRVFAADLRVENITRPASNPATSPCHNECTRLQQKAWKNWDAVTANKRFINYSFISCSFCLATL